MKKTRTLVALLFAFATVATSASAQLSSSETTTSWNVGLECHGNHYSYYNWIYKDANGTHAFIGTSDLYQGNAFCTNHTDGFTSSSTDGEGYSLTANGGNGNVTYTPPATGILYPKFKIASIIYDTPGNHSNNGFTGTLTDGTTTSTASNFGVGVTDTFTVDNKVMGIGDTLSWSFGVSSTSGNSTAVTDTIAQATGVLNATNTSAPNAINHQQDLFVIWLNPAVTFTQTGTNAATYKMGTQLQTAGDPSPGQPEIQDHVEVFAQAMMANSSGVTTVPVQTLQPQVVDGQTMPGLANICAKLISGYPGTCTLANQCGCVPGDFTAVLNQDLLLKFTSTESPMNANTSSAALCTNPKPTASCRFVPIMVANGSSTQIVELLQGPDNAGGNSPINTFTQTDSTQTTQSLTESSSYSVGYSWDVGWKFLGAGLDFKSATLFTWTNTESAGEINGSAHQMSVSLSSSTVGCSEYIPIFEDTTYHTFVFQGQVGDTSCP